MTAHDEVRQLLQRYARAADDRDVTALASLFHPGAEIVGARGTQTKEQWLATMAGPRAFPVSMHMIGDPLIDVDAGGEAATVDSYAVVYQLSEPGSGAGDLTLGIRYRDEAVVHEGRWVLRRRRADTLWMR
ncbi:MAG: nuclear transport factor 2 family protein [Acidimicrobiales bacterium]